MEAVSANVLRLSSRAIAAALVILSLLGCATVSIRSVRDPSFSDPIHKLFVILNHGQVDNIDPLYTPYLVVALKEEFSQKGIEAEIRVLSPLALNENAYLAEIASWKPDAVLTIVTSGGVTTGTGMAKILYDVSLFDQARNKRIWRAQIDASGGTAVREKRMKLMAQDLIKRLSEDKLISSEPRKKGPQI